VETGQPGMAALRTDAGEGHKLCLAETDVCAATEFRSRLGMPITFGWMVAGREAAGYRRSVTTTGAAAATASARRARPGRGVLVAADLADLRGPVTGVVELPLRLFWSAADRTFDLDDPDMLRSTYEKVLREAIQPGELAAYLNGGTLITVWPQLFLLRELRQAWEQRHPVLGCW
jgi:hypothetical protein